ncbi:MAG: hypothetical protein KTR24_12230 [Saprospiraceae bacterium]|nr:hypothetical protein [Saprospiraceae bacterium]
MKCWIYLAVLAILCSCAPIEEQGTQSAFFSMADLVDQHLQGSDSLVDVVKTITVDGTPERQELKAYKINRDIQGFASLDIDRPALWEKYQVDTSKLADGERVFYQALADDLSIRSVEIITENGEVSRVRTLKRANTFLADVQSEYDWVPSMGYTILRNEKRLFADPSQHEITVEIQR